MKIQSCSYVCPQTWLNEARKNTDLSPAMGFLNENGSFTCFAILREFSSDLCFTAGFFKTSSFLSLLVGFLGGKEGYTLQHPNVKLDQED